MSSICLPLRRIDGYIKLDNDAAITGWIPYHRKNEGKNGGAPAHRQCLRPRAAAGDA